MVPQPFEIRKYFEECCTAIFLHNGTPQHCAPTTPSRVGLTTIWSPGQLIIFRPLIRHSLVLISNMNHFKILLSHLPIS